MMNMHSRTMGGYLWDLGRQRDRRKESTGRNIDTDTAMIPKLSSRLTIIQLIMCHKLANIK